MIYNEQQVTTSLCRAFTLLFFSLQSCFLYSQNIALEVNCNLASFDNIQIDSFSVQNYSHIVYIQGNTVLHGTNQLVIATPQPVAGNKTYRITTNSMSLKCLVKLKNSTRKIPPQPTPVQSLGRQEHDFDLEVSYTGNSSFLTSFPQLLTNVMAERKIGYTSAVIPPIGVTGIYRESFFCERIRVCLFCRPPPSLLANRYLT